MRVIDHLVAGGQTATDAASARPEERWGDVFDPNSGQVQASVMLGDAALLERAVAAAQAAQPGWAATNPQRRARVMFRFRNWSSRIWTRWRICSPPNMAR